MAPQTQTTSHNRVILVDDDENVRRSLTMLLRARGFSVDAYASGSEILGNRQTPDADCMIIDYKMPRIDGLEVIKRLRKRGNVTPALMITGFFSNTLKERALEAGYNDILEKPSEGRSIMDRVRDLISRSQAQEL